MWPTLPLAPAEPRPRPPTGPRLSARLLRLALRPRSLLGPRSRASLLRSACSLHRGRLVLLGRRLPASPVWLARKLAASPPRGWPVSTFPQASLGELWGRASFSDPLDCNALKEVVAQTRWADRCRWRTRSTAQHGPLQVRVLVPAWVSLRYGLVPATLADGVEDLLCRAGPPGRLEGWPQKTALVRESHPLAVQSPLRLRQRATAEAHA